MDSRIVAQDVLSGRHYALIFKGQAFEMTLTDEDCGGPPIGKPNGLFISPGWVDLQVNGFAGYDINTPAIRVDDVRQINARLWQEGVTAWCPTVVTAPTSQIENSLRVLARACETDPWVAASVLGIHLEGPYISPAEGARGSHPVQPIHAPDRDEFSRWQTAAGGRIRVVTLAPEQPGGIDFTTWLARQGIVVAIGHTQASTAIIHAAVAAGANLSTHLGNGIESRLPRHPNPIWDQLAEDRLFASLIFDGFHLPANVMRVLLKAKGLDRCLLVSDTTALARRAPGIYSSYIGEKVELHPNGKLSMLGTQYLAGSASSLKDGVENAMRLAGCTLTEAVRLAAVNPTRLLPGAPDVVIIFKLNPETVEVTLMATCIQQKVVYRNPDLPA
jgi:N-acetylglucosamine-6-phosphate deacetylase